MGQGKGKEHINKQSNNDNLHKILSTSQSPSLLFILESHCFANSPVTIASPGLVRPEFQQRPELKSFRVAPSTYLDLLSTLSAQDSSTRPRLGGCCVDMPSAGTREAAGFTGLMLEEATGTANSQIPYHARCFQKGWRKGRANVVQTVIWSVH